LGRHGGSDPSTATLSKQPHEPRPRKGRRHVGQTRVAHTSRRFLSGCMRHPWLGCPNLSWPCWRAESARSAQRWHGKWWRPTV
jgi:hypothetical protein